MTTVSLKPKISQVNKLPRKENSPLSDRKDPNTRLIVHSDEAVAISCGESLHLSEEREGLQRGCL